MRLTLVLLLLLAACGDPRTGCLNRADAPLRALDAEIAETELALARGYRLAPGARITTGLAVCASDSPLTFCLSGERPLTERRIAIDRASERARLRALERQRPALAAQAARAAAVCPAS